MTPRAIQILFFYVICKNKSRTKKWQNTPVLSISSEDADFVNIILQSIVQFVRHVKVLMLSVATAVV